MPFELSAGTQSSQADAMVTRIHTGSADPVTYEVYDDSSGSPGTLLVTFDLGNTPYTNAGSGVVQLTGAPYDATAESTVGAGNIPAHYILRNRAGDIVGTGDVIGDVTSTGTISASQPCRLSAHALQVPLVAP